ncbi:hypothetical protein D9619_005231 [Psilocybe cf. subviscida]|uniref:Glycoside hydrolase family 25 protein n=1 Tax=Psilocybe cf. subviscida TaxID=2480587 RepID=A0A8H5BWD1_9AGAR|nr:hypothetical protein D9619_005231 [Psilocybe cf. subviscida]
MFKALLLLPFYALSAYALISAVDSSSLVPTATWQKALSQGFTKAIIRGYTEACSVGGKVDPNFVQSYKNARAAGYTNIDTYWYPCTGSGNACKSFSTQLAELGATFDANAMKIGKIWVDIESDTICDTWNYGASGNQAQAKALISAIKASGYVYGIYSTPGVWSNIFGSTSFVLDNSAPLWFATFNNVQTLTLGTPFGGQVLCIHTCFLEWTSAVGHQYTDQSASGLFDLNVFAS